VIIIDSNLIIYAAEPHRLSLRQAISQESAAVSAISRLETQGYHSLRQNEIEFFTAFFAATLQIAINDEVLDKAIELRQKQSMSVADAIIASTALLLSAELYTRNTKDFDWIPGLKVVNPIDENFPP